MARTTVWQDEYWLLLLQLYLSKPAGLKPTYCREAVELSTELHIPPTEIAARMQQIDQLSTPRVEHFWQVFHDNPRRLARAVRLYRDMRGFGSADEFYRGVELQESFEKDFRPLAEEERLTPIALIIILDLYFQLIPQTMVAATPEVIDTAKMLKVPTQLVVEVLDNYQLCDPYLNRSDISMSVLLMPCQQTWQRFANTDPQALSTLASDLSAYYRT